MPTLHIKQMENAILLTVSITHEIYIYVYIFFSHETHSHIDYANTDLRLTTYDLRLTSGVENSSGVEFGIQLFKKQNVFF